MAVRVLLINDSTSNPNWGDRAAALSLKTLVERQGGQIEVCITEDDLIAFEFGDGEPSEAGTESSESHGFKELVKAVMPPIAWRMAARLYSPRDRDPQSGHVPTDWADFERQAASFRSSDQFEWLASQCETVDVAVIHGDGAILGGDLVGRSILFLAYVIRRHLGIPVALVNHTADLDTPVIQTIVENVYPLLDDIVYRDEMSAAVCGDSLGGDYGADTAFCFIPSDDPAWPAIVGRNGYFGVWPDTAIFSPEDPYVCVGGSSIHSFDPNRLPQEVMDGYRSLVERLMSVYAGQVVLTVSDLKDEYFFRPLARELEVPVVGLTTPVQQAVDIVGNADAYIGGRWHPSIFALSGGVPVVPISSKTHKMRSLCASAGLPERVFDATNILAEVDDISDRLTDLLSEGKSLRRRLRQWAAEQRSLSQRNAQIVADIAMHAAS